MLKVVIVEDESLAVKKLESLLLRYSAEIEVQARLASVRSAVKWFSQNPEPDLIFMDIHLEDGLSFSILELQPISAPVIFTTAFDEFTANAFQGVSADFLLKPIDFEDLKTTLDRVCDCRPPICCTPGEMHRIKIFIDKKDGLRRFLLENKSQLRIIHRKDVSYFFQQGETTCMVTWKGEFIRIDESVEGLASALDLSNFLPVPGYLITCKSIVNVRALNEDAFQVTLFPSGKADLLLNRVDIDRLNYLCNTDLKSEM